MGCTLWWCPIGIHTYMFYVYIYKLEKITMNEWKIIPKYGRVSYEFWLIVSIVCSIGCVWYIFSICISNKLSLF